MSASVKFAAFAAAACVLGFTVPAYAIAFDEPVEKTDPLSWMLPGQRDVAAEPLATPMPSVPWSSTFRAPKGRGAGTLLPSFPMDERIPPFQGPFIGSSGISGRKSLVQVLPFKRPVTFQPIPTHWDYNPLTLIPTQCDARILLLASPLQGITYADSASGEQPQSPPSAGQLR